MNEPHPLNHDLSLREGIGCVYDGGSDSSDVNSGTTASVRPKRSADLTGSNESGMIVKLPCWVRREVCWQERPILENSTACTCQMPNNLDFSFG